MFFDSPNQTMTGQLTDHLLLLILLCGTCYQHRCVWLRTVHILKVCAFDIVLFHESLTSEPESLRNGMCCEGSPFYVHTHTFIHEWYEPCLCLPSRSWVLILPTSGDERLSQPSWLVKYLDGLPA